MRRQFSRRFVPTVDSLMQRIAPGDLSVMPDIVPMPTPTCDWSMPDPVQIPTNVYGAPKDTSVITNNATDVTQITVSIV